jgi:hypothetical protein
VAISIDGILFPALSNDGQLFKVGTSCPAWLVGPVMWHLATTMSWLNHYESSN